MEKTEPKLTQPTHTQLTHVRETGEARMVDVGQKAATDRRAVATARVAASSGVLSAIQSMSVGKGDVLAAARIAGIQAAKKTSELIPLCHLIALTSVEVSFELDSKAAAILIRAEARAVDRTGVEMEAMVAASVAALTIYDMTKSMDRWMRIEGVQLEEKSGGKSGSVRRPGK